METLNIKPQNPLLHYPKSTKFMNSLLSRFGIHKPRLPPLNHLPPLPCLSNLKPFSTANSPTPTPTPAPTQTPLPVKKSELSRARVKVGAKAAELVQLKENWLDSLSYPFPAKTETSDCGGADLTPNNVGSSLVIGIDPDLSGALALLKIDESGCSAQVFDSPHLKVMVGNRIRKRLDVKSIVQLIRSFDAPIGTTAYIEQSTPFPQDGKQGWWSGGFGYGLWIGVLVASGFSVVPVSSVAWKSEFELSGGSCTKDDSRRIASALFPSLSPVLQRKKDHGRAEALLIAAYGKGMKIKSSPCISEELP